jgi:acyl carrier protein
MNTQDFYDTLIKLVSIGISDGSLPAYLKNMKLEPDIHLDDLAIDSIALVELLAGLMDKTDSYLPESLFSNNPSLWELSQRATEYMSNGS